MREQVRNRYGKLSNEEKNIKRECGKNRYHNMSKEKKERILLFFLPLTFSWFLEKNVLLKLSFMYMKNQLILIK